MPGPQTAATRCVLGLVVSRIALHRLWPERLRPAAFIFTAPPAAVGLALLPLGAPLLWVWALWARAVLRLLWVGTLTRRIAQLPFGLAHWGMRFALASLTAVTGA